MSDDLAGPDKKPVDVGGGYVLLDFVTVLGLSIFVLIHIVQSCIHFGPQLFLTRRILVSSSAKNCLSGTLKIFNGGKLTHVCFLQIVSTLICVYLSLCVSAE